MKEHLICIASPAQRVYYRAVPVAKEFLDKDMNIINSTGTIPDGDVSEYKVSTKTLKQYKGGKLNGHLQMIDLNTGDVTFTEQYKNGVLIDVADVTLRDVTRTTETVSAPAYQGTLLKVNKHTLSFYVDGKEVAEITVAANGTTLEQLGEIPDGVAKELDENGQVRLEMNYRQNQLEGELRRYNEHGLLLSQETYEKGQLHGPAKYYSYSAEGQAMVSAHYNRTLLEGEWTSTFPGGKIHSTATYQRGKLNGPKNVYYPNGKINVKETYQNGKRQGPRLVYFPEGALWYQENYKNGHLDGERLCFFPNGHKYIEEFYNDGLLDGLRKTFTEAGSLLTQEQYHWGTLVHNTERKPLQ